ncbi:hypothetical protein LCGC14_3149140, partial [marine sediment metagenome]
GVTVCLLALKLILGIISGSIAVLSDAIDSATDVVGGTAALVSIRVAAWPADQDHPYGHGRAESIATGVISIVIAMAGLLIVGRTVYSIIVGDTVVPTLIALVAALVPIVIKEILYHYVAYQARKFKSSLLMASAADHRKDAITSVATLAGIAGARMGYPLLDPLAAGLVSLAIFKLAYDTATRATRELMDRIPEDTTMRDIKKIVLECEGVEHAYVRARSLGPNIFMEIKIDIDPELTVSEGHGIAKSVKSKIIAEVEGTADVLVHVNPHYD